MRIVSLVPSVTETLFALGLEDQIVGITRFCVLPKERVRLKQKVGGTKDPQLDKVLKLKPDIVLMNHEENRKEDAEFLENQGIRLLITFPNSIQQAADIVNELGKVFHAEEKARPISTEICNQMVTYHPPGKRRTLVLIWRHPYMTVNHTTYVHSVCTFFGFENLFADAMERYPRLTHEQIREANPEVVLFPDEPYAFQSKHLNEFRKNFPELVAVKRNKLLLFPGVYLTWHGFGTLRALRELPALLEKANIWS